MAETWQKMMKRLKLESIKAKAPGFFEASGGFTMSVKPYSDRTTNALTRSIIDFLQFHGHYANRINTQGQARVNKIERFNIYSQQMQTVGEKVTWTKSSTRKGTPDIDAIIHRQPVKIEIKVGSDTIKQSQRDEQVKIETAGGLYFVARTMPQFLEWYDTISV